jgi:hypothetical protein
MPSENKTFRFLTFEEFNRLTRGEKMGYLERAAAELKRRETKKASLFRDAPRRPKKR